MGSVLEMTSATHAATHRATSHAAHASSLHHFTGFLATKDIQAIDDTNHTIAIYTIIGIYRSTVLSHRTSDVALFLQDVVPFKAQC